MKVGGLGLEWDGVELDLGRGGGECRCEVG